MKFIQRSFPEPPELAYFRKKYSSWKDAVSNKVNGRSKTDGQSSQDKKAYEGIKQALLRMQSWRCAYCEVRLKQSQDAHVEHFESRAIARKKHQNNRKDFEWSNLFASCESKQSCGHIKANSSIDGVFKPDELDFGRIANCFSYAWTGEMRPGSALDQENQQRAKKTIDIFGLNTSALVAARGRAFILIQQHFAYECMNRPDKQKECARKSANTIKQQLGFDSACDFWGERPEMLSVWTLGEKKQFSLKRMLRL